LTFDINGDIDKLYEAQTAANLHRQAMEKRMNTLQAAVDRLTTFMEKVLPKRRRNSPGEPPKV
jgi:hypothetical protein